jgi:hypothetical protein
MDVPDAGCGPLFACYRAAHRGDADAMRSAWRDVEVDASSRGSTVDAAVTAAVDSGETARVVELLEPVVFGDESAERIDGILAQVVGKLLWSFGYLAAFVLFVRAHSPEAVVGRLRWAYCRVGVDLRAAESTDGVERTIFACPYRSVGADRWGERRVCHDVLDRVDDGYVSFLARHRDIAYDRPRPCVGGDCCYSEVAEA